MSLQTDIDNDLKSIFLNTSEFAVAINATSWGLPSLGGIFDREIADYDDVSKSIPFILIETAEMPSTADTGDLFVISGVTYKLVNIQYHDPGMSKITLAAT